MRCLKFAWLFAIVIISAPISGAHAQSSFGLGDSEQTSDSERDTPTNTAGLPIEAEESPRFKPNEIGSDQRISDDSSPLSASERRQERRERAKAQRRVTAASEYEKYVSSVAQKPLRRFGSNLIIPDARDFTAPPDTTVPLDYRINSGDVIILGLTGSILSNNTQLVVDSEGMVFVPEIGSVRVGGVRYGDLETVMARQVSRFYRGFDISVSMGKLKGITVYVTGFARAPGAYTVSSFSTLVNAVIAAGGPASGGSFRSIQLKRNGNIVSDFDLYALLMNGDKSGDVLLQNGDIVHILPVGSQAAIYGSVNNEAIFEYAPDDTINDILFYAGGVSTVADASRLFVFDPLNSDAGGWQEISPTAISERGVKRSEIIRVLSNIGLKRSLGNQSVLVAIDGEVNRPGYYYLDPGSNVGDLIERAGGLTEQAYTYASVFTRTSVMTQQQQSYDRALADMELLLTSQPLVNHRQGNISQGEQLALVKSVVSQLKKRTPDGRIVMDTNPSTNSLPVRMILNDGDTLLVPARPITVGIFGAVINPATFEFKEAQTVGDYLRLAGGYQKMGDKSEVFVVRANGSVEKSGKGLFKGKGLLKQPAYPGDLIFVPVDTNRGAFWAKIRDISQILFSTALTASVIDGL